MKKSHCFLGIAALLISIAANAFPQTAYAEDNLTEIGGQVYIVEDEEGGFAYTDQKVEDSSSSNTYGTFSLSGDLKKTADVNGFTAFNAVGNVDEATGEDNSEIAFVYQYDDSLLNADETKEWKLYSDSSKKIGDIDLGEKVENGAIVFQSSFDGKNWNTDQFYTNVFEDLSENSSDPFYTTTVNQLVNGCYYRVTVAYETRKKSGNQQVGPVKAWATYDYQEHVEVYEFYICNLAENEKAAKPADTPKYNLNSDPVNAGMDNGYSKKDAIETDDVHSGWSIGQFYINGFSGNAHFYQGDESKKENPIFLKNVGDKVTLWFRLDQKDLDALDGNEHLSINPDEKGSDQYFHISPQNFKRGALIIKFTDYQNNTRTNVYTDYLAAAATTSANTKVQLFEEGDYEVALDYEIKDNSPLAWKIPKPAQYTAYRIYFEFSVRNSNCMVYPIDLKTGSELRTSYTENGFRLDMARSRYLDLSVKKSVLTSDGLDLRESQISNDQEEFADEGIYKFTVKNKITEDEVTKTIYVGSDNLLKAYVKYGGEYSIADLNEMKDSGYTFDDDGRLIAPEPEQQEEVDDVADTISNDGEQTTDAEDVPVVVNETMPKQSSEDEKIDPAATESSSATDGSEVYNEDAETSSGLMIPVVIVIVAVVIVCAVVISRKKSATKGKSNESDDVNDGNNASGNGRSDDERGGSL